MAGFTIQATRSHTRLVSREACRRAAVKPKPARMSLYSPARLRRAEAGAGLQPCQTGEPRGPLPSGGNSAAKPHVSLRPCAAPPRRSGCRALALPDRRAARPVAERRPWGRKRRKREAHCRVFPERLSYLYAPARLRRAEAGAGLQPCLMVPSGLKRGSFSR